MGLIKNKYWYAVEFNNSEVNIDFISCMDKESPWDDYKIMHEIVAGPIRRLRSSKDIVKEMRFMVKHIERKTNEILFRKCSDPRSNHCSNSQIISQNAWKYLAEREFKWPNPIPSLNHPDHFMTFLEMEQLDADALQTGDDGLPCSINTGSCPYCDNFLFFSEAEKRNTFQYCIII